MNITSHRTCTALAFSFGPLSIILSLFHSHSHSLFLSFSLFRELFTCYEPYKDKTVAEVKQYILRDIRPPLEQIPQEVINLSLFSYQFHLCFICYTDPIQFNPIQSNPIQSNPIQSNPI
jgi:hypothetical protein